MEKIKKASRLRSKNKIVAVGMSGGIDSTIAAYLLKQLGYEVIGLTMKIWDGSFKFPKSDKPGCFGPSEAADIKAAQKMAKKLGIKHYVIPVEAAYKKTVLDYFKKEYLAGHTPNPCIVCNQKIKFGLLLETAKQSGIKFDYFATGHYARVDFDKKLKRFILKKGKDQTKDQSYFLYRLSQTQLKNLIFPLSSLTKKEVKKLAEKLGFKELSAKPESQDFLECSDHSVLFKKSELKPGDIINQNDKVVGQHNGIINYTIGQRKGISNGGSKVPLYVIKIDALKNQILIGPRDLLYTKKLVAILPHWISIDKPNKSFITSAKVRLGAQETACQIKPLKNKLEIKLDKPQLAVTPGQSIVFYQKEIMLGGAIIAKNLS
jgi:tRNA-specific 2-thiouridylase